MVMTAHVLFKQLDPAFPATLSERIIGDLLRREMGYTGVVITDDLDMGAVAATHTLQESAVGALRAGADVLLICHSIEKAVAARSAVRDAVEAGVVSAAFVEKALERIRNLKSMYQESFSPCDTGEVREYFANR